MRVHARDLPELASLAAAAAVARVAIVAAHPDLGSNHSDHAIVRLPELLVTELEVPDTAVAAYIRLEQYRDRAAR